MVISTTAKEMAMHAYLRLIVLKSMPLSYVADPIVRSFCKFNFRFGLPYTKLVIAEMTKLVEARIAQTMKGTKGAIIHDGWSSNGTHFFGVFASFMRDVPVLRNGISQIEQELCLPLLSVSPLPCSESDENTSKEEAESFNAESHLRHLQLAFEYFEQDVHKWVLCSISDNCAVNKRLESCCACHTSGACHTS
eukprot:IDg22214t1